MTSAGSRSTFGTRVVKAIQTSAPSSRAPATMLHASGQSSGSRRGSGGNAPRRVLGRHAIEQPRRSDHASVLL